MAQNRQTSSDYRDIDLSVDDYVAENGQFLVYVGTGGTVKQKCPATGLDVTFTCVDGERMEFFTSKVYKVGTTATNLKAIY